MPSLRGVLSWICALLFVAGALPSKPEGVSHRDTTLVQGLEIWRKPGAIQDGAACATCHSPDGIELAAYGFDDADIQRRASPHVGNSDAQVLVTYIHALRTKFGFRKLLDPNEYRPLQPGGAVLPGKTPADRDLAFGYELQKKLPLLFVAKIETLPQAKAAEQELLRVSASSLRVGIPFNRLSEDVAHGNEHSSIAQWLPEVPATIPSDRLAEWYAAEDRYLSNPTQAELHSLLLLHQQLVNTSRMLGFGELSADKFRALLVLQDRIRNKPSEGVVSGDVLAYGNFNPIWQVGEVAREFVDRNPAGLGMAPDVQTKKLSGPSLSEQMHRLRVSWFWAGWLSDQGLFKSSHDDKVRLGMWLSESLSKDGPYPIHNVYANARRQAVVSNELVSWGEPPARRRRIWDFAGLRAFHAYVRDIPTQERYRRLYLAFTANCFRMNLLLLADDIQKSGQVWMKRNTLANIKELAGFISTHFPEDKAAMDELQARLGALIETARDRV